MPKNTTTTIEPGTSPVEIIWPDGSCLRLVYTQEGVKLTGLGRASDGGGVTALLIAPLHSNSILLNMD